MVKIPEGIPDSTDLPTNLYDFKVESMEPGESSTGKFQIETVLRVLKPKESKGLTHYQRHVIGTNDDPAAKDEATWKRGFAIDYKKMCGVAGVKIEGRDLKDVCEEMAGQKLSGYLVYSLQAKFNRDGSENAYAGRPQVRAQAWYQLGDKEAGSMPETGAGKPAAAATVKKPPKAPPPPEEEEEEEEAPAAKPKSGKAPARRAPDPEEEDDD